jgi:hypothetical protein
MHQKQGEVINMGWFVIKVLGNLIIYCSEAGARVRIHAHYNEMKEGYNPHNH